MTASPHAIPPYPTWLSILKILYLFIDSVLGWVLHIRPFISRGGWVVVERGWWDLVIDRRRYRLSRGRRLLMSLGRLLPPPRATIILTAPASVIRARKSELGADELERQMQAWRRLADKIPGASVIDASRPLDAVVEVAYRACLLKESHRPASARQWAAIPPGRRVRWLVPTRPPRVAEGGLRIYQPMTRTGRVGWEAARTAARLGLLRALPRGDASDLASRLAPLVPTGGSIAVAHVRDNRSVVLILDRSGLATAVTKIARDPSGIAQLAGEAERLLWLGGFLEQPLSAPRVISAQDGMLVLEPVRWRPRSHPWYLPPHLSAGIGRFYRRTIDARGTTGLCHGDFAPWNVMRAADGWVLVDWEVANSGCPPFADPLHYLVQAHALLGRPRQDELLAGLRGQGWVGRSLDAYADAAGLRASEGASDGFIAYLHASMEAADTSRADGRRGLEARMRLLEAFGTPE